MAVITPAYITPQNGRLALFAQTINSVVTQRLCQVRLVYLVVDDGSTVDLKSFVEQWRDPRVRYVRRQRSATDLQTASNALNLGFDLCLAKDPHVFSHAEARDLCAATYLHSDDLLTQDSVERRALRLNGGCVHTAMACFHNDGTVKKIMSFKCGTADQVMAANAAGKPLYNHHTFMWDFDFLRRLRAYVAEKYAQGGIFDTALSHGEDKDMTLSSIVMAIEQGLPVVYLPQITVFYRLHEQSISGRSADAAYVASQQDRLYRKHFCQRPPGGRPHELQVKVLSDLPWSLGTFLPLPVKALAKRFRNRVKQINFRTRHPELERQLDRLLEHSLPTPCHPAKEAL